MSFKKSVYTILLLCLFSSMTYASTAFTPPTSIVRYLVSENSFGQCMALVQDNPSNRLSGCGSDWISFDCSGDFHDPSFGDLMFQQVQMAFALNKQVRLLYTNEQKHNGYCVAKRVDVL